MKNSHRKKILLDKILKSDEFIRKLGVTIPGWLAPGNIWCFDYVMSHLPSQAPILEIGSFCGLSTNVITYLKLKYGVKNKLICIDPWIFEEGDINGNFEEHPYLTNREYNDFVKDSFIRNVSLFSRHDLPFAIQSTSDFVFTKWEQNKIVKDLFEREIQLGSNISFAYIDGNHSYDFVYRDFMNVDRFLEIGGFILFDDSANGGNFQGICQVVAEVIASERYEIVKQNPNYLLKKIN